MFRRSLFAACLLTIAGCAQTPPAATTRTVVVFFTADSAALDQAAQSAVTEAASFAQQHPTTPVHVRGFATPDAGSPAFNRSLANTRAQGVANALVQAGVPRARLSMENRGAVAYDLMPTESRRVEIVIGS